MLTTYTSMTAMIEARIAEYGPEFTPDTPHSPADWREWLDGDAGDGGARLIASDDRGSEAWADDCCMLLSLAGGGEHLRGQDDICASVRARLCNDGEVQAMDDAELWRQILAGTIEPW